MTNDNVYLKQNIVFEPLFNRWHAWTNLIAPASAAMYIANSHLKIMESFVSAPHLHASALRNPAMIGGPFINYDASKADEISQLVKKTRREQSYMLEFAEAVKQADLMLQAEATGYSMELLYRKIPEILKGYVELVYDMHNRPSLRFLEGLLYKSKYYNSDSQSIALSQMSGEARSFVFSTPRLNSDDRLFLTIPFADEAIDELFKMKFAPGSYRRIVETLRIDQESEDLFSTFFTEEAPGKCAGYENDLVRIRYFGHACILIEAQGHSILTDPVISYRDDFNHGQYTYADLPPRIDQVLITHGHQDHIIFESLLQLRHKVDNFIVPRSSGATMADPSLKLILKTIGFNRVWEIDELESIEIPGGRIVALPFFGEHSDLNIRTKVTYLIEIRGKRILLLADSNNLEPKLYEHIRDLFGEIDILFIGMECEGAPMSWLYGPMMTIPVSRKDDQSRRLDGSNYEKAIAIVDLLKPKEIYVYAMGQEHWLSFLTSIQYTDQSQPIIESDKLVNVCRARGLHAERLFNTMEILL